MEDQHMAQLTERLANQKVFPKIYLEPKLMSKLFGQQQVWNVGKPDQPMPVGDIVTFQEITRKGRKKGKPVMSLIEAIHINDEGETLIRIAPFITGPM